MENQPNKLNSSKEVIAYLAETFPRCFTLEGEARPLKIGILRTLLLVYRKKRCLVRPSCVLLYACILQAGAICMA